METLWIARDKNGDLYLYSHKPVKLSEQFIAKENNVYVCIDDIKSFPEITWENSPQQVELKSTKLKIKMMLL